MFSSSSRRSAYAIVVATIFVASPSTARAQCDLQQSVELLTPSPTEAVGFGRSVAIDGHFLVVGAQNDPPAGAAYVYRFVGTGWTQQAKLTVPGLPDGARFGYSVDIDGNVILVGARNDDGAAPGSGAAYIFRRDGSQWIVEDKLVGLDPRMYDHFGVAVALDGDRVLVGTVGEAGGADVFRRDGTNWVHEAALRPPFYIAETYGYAVALDGGFAVVGDHGNAFATNANGTETAEAVSPSGANFAFRHDGTTWVFDSNPWPTLPVGVITKGLGGAVALQDDTLATTYWRENLSNPQDEHQGGAIFRRIGGEWVHEAELLPSDVVPSSFSPYPAGISIMGDRLVLGGTQIDGDGSSRGAAYLFQRDGAAWSQIAKLTPSDPVDSDRFGQAIAITNTHAVVGNSFHQHEGFEVKGGAYIFDITDCNDNATPDSCDIESEFSPDEDGNGIPDECCPIPCVHALASDGIGTQMNRFVSFIVPVIGAGYETAIEIELVALNHQCSAESDNVFEPCSIDDDCTNGVCEAPFASSEGQVRYVNVVKTCQGLESSTGKVTCRASGTCDIGEDCIQMRMCGGTTDLCATGDDCSEGVSCLVSMTCPDDVFKQSFLCATTGCEPEYRDWASDLAGGVLHVYGPGIVPARSEYNMRQIPAACAGNETKCPSASDPFMIATARWADMTADGATNAQDIAAASDKVKPIPEAFTKPRTMLIPGILDPFRDVNVLELQNTIDAVKSLPVPGFITGPEDCGG